MPPRIFTTKRIEGEVAVQGATQAEIMAEAGQYSRAAITVERADGLKCWTPQQRHWWKGILLPQLSKHTGDSVGYWEDLLKLKVMPDEFAPVITKTENGEFEHLPSITILNRNQMREKIEGAVAQMRDETIYCYKFHWVILPDPELRS